MVFRNTLNAKQDDFRCNNCEYKFGTEKMEELDYE